MRKKRSDWLVHFHSIFESTPFLCSLTFSSAGPLHVSFTFFFMHTATFSHSLSLFLSAPFVFSHLLRTTTIAESARATTMQRPKIEPCDICGDIGFHEVIVTCIKCKVSREHCYCMQKHSITAPVNWVCESCQSKHGTTSTCIVNQDPGQQASKRKGVATKGKVKFIQPDEVIKLSSGNFPSKPSPAKSTLLMTQKDSVKSRNVISNVSSPALKSNPSIIPPIVLKKLQGNDGVPKNSVIDQHAYRTLSKGPMKEHIQENQKLQGRSVPDKKVQTRDLCIEKPTEGIPCEAISARKSLHGVGSGGILCAVDECHNIERGDIQSIKKGIRLYGKFLPSSIAAWRGSFDASGKFYAELEAHPPGTVSAKAYQFSRRMPSVLRLESLPRMDVLTDIFQNDCPNLKDIALYFFPSNNTEGSRKQLNSITELMNAEKSMLRSSIDGVELLVFTSNQLNIPSRGTVAVVHVGCFLWGLFYRSKVYKATGMEPADMDVDMIGGKDIAGRVDQVLNAKQPRSISQHCNPLNMSDVPPGFETCGKWKNVSV